MMLKSASDQHSMPYYALMRILPGPLRRRLEQRPNLAKILDNIGWLFFDKILRLGVGLLVGVWVARYLGPEQFGRLNYAIAFVSLFAALSGLGLSGIVMRDIVRAPAKADTILGTAFFIQVISGILSIALAIAAINWLKPQDNFAKLSVQILSLGLIFKSSEIVKYWFESQVQSRYAIWVENAAILLIAATKVIFIITEGKIIAFVWITLAEAGITSIGYFWIYINKKGTIKSWIPNLKYGKQLLHNAFPLLLSSISTIIYMRIDVIMIDSLIGANETGLYSAATNISELLYIIPVIITSSLSPLLIKTSQLDKNKYEEMLRKLYFYLAWMAILTALLLSLTSSAIIDILYGPEYKNSAKILEIHLWGGVAVYLGVASSQFLLCENLVKLSFYRTLAGMISNILLNLLLIPTHGGAGAAIATVISYFIATFSLILFNSTRQHTLQLMSALNYPRKEISRPKQ